MRIALGVDHRGFAVKDDLLRLLSDLGHEAADLGAYSADPVDYPDVAEAVGRAVQRGEADRGIVVCGSGAGAQIAANKLRGIRAAQAGDTYTAHQSVEHDDANVLALGSSVVGVELMREIVRAFLEARFDGGTERYRRRLEKVEALERSERERP